MSVLEMTVRDFLTILADVRDLVLAADSVTASMGGDEWQEAVTVAEFKAIMRSPDHPGNAIVRHDAEARMTSTLQQIEALPVTP